ncbi:MAG TPA: TolC family protein [Chitinophagaceae bacterium]|nr:TolC family protein [Chitinophagaceae bacterium]
MKEMKLKRPLKKAGIPVVLICFLLHLSGFGQDTTGGNLYSLQRCVDLALKGNASVKAAEFTLRGDKAYLLGAIGNLIPNINAYASRSIDNGKSINPYTNSYVNQSQTADNYQLSGSIVLWNGSSIFNYLRENSLAYKAGKMDWQQAKDQASIIVILDYLTVLNLQDQLTSANSQAEVSGDQVVRLTDQNQEGAINPSDLFNEKGQLASNELLVITDQNSLQTAKINLCKDMNIPYDTAMRLEPVPASTLGPYAASVDDIFRYASQNLPMMKAAELHEESAQKGVKSARGQLYPTISVSGGLSTNYSSAATSAQLIGSTDQPTSSYVLNNSSKEIVYSPQPSYNTLLIPYNSQFTNNFNSYVSLNLQIPILRNLSGRVRVAQAKIAESQTYFNLTTTRNLLKEAIQQDYFNMTSAYESYKKLVDEVADYTESFREATVKFNLGAITSVDYITTQNFVNQAQLNLISTKYTYILYTKILDYYQGKLGISTTGP